MNNKKDTIKFAANGISIHKMMNLIKSSNYSVERNGGFVNG